MPAPCFSLECRQFSISQILRGQIPHSVDRALASKNAAAFAASNVSAVPLAIRTSRLRPALALRLTSHVGTPSCVNTNNMNSPTSVQTAGSGHRAGRGCHSTSAMCFPYRTGTSSAASPVGPRTCSRGALSFSRPCLASGITGRLALGLQGDIIGGLPGDLGTAGSLLGFHRSIAGGLRGFLGGIAGGLLVGLTGNAGQSDSVTLGSARVASDAHSLSGDLSFGECRIVCLGSRTKLLQLRLLRVRGCAQSVVEARSFSQSSSP